MDFKYTAEEKITVWLDSLPSLTYREKSEIIERIPLKELISDIKGCKEKLTKLVPLEKYQEIEDTLKREEYLTELLEELREKKIFFVTQNSKNYPKELKYTPCAPLVLYCKGKRDLLVGKKFAVVGSRKMLPWAKKLTEKTAAELSRHFTVVTGMADGGDEAALLGALKEGNGAISVLAYGFDYVYPAKHASLIERVAKEGLLVSEHKPSVKPQKFLFPARNRIIAGLCQGVLVTGAAKRSGTTITATYAGEFGRDVFAFPYNVGIIEGEGCNALIKQGAILTDGGEDILSTYGIKLNALAVELTPEEEKVVALLKENGELHIEKMAASLSLPVYALSGILSELEVKGVVARSGGNCFAVVGK